MSDASIEQFSPAFALQVDLSSTDADLTKFSPFPYARALQVGGAGTLKVDLQGSTAITFTVIAGQVLQGTFLKVYKTGTAATLIVALA